MANSILLALIATVALTWPNVIDAQSISVGNGNIIYQILFSQWANPAGKLFTGASCHFIGKTCDTRFTGYVDMWSRIGRFTFLYIEKYSMSDASSRNASELTWPGPNTHIKNWPIIGHHTYKSNGLTDFAYLNLTGVERDKFREAILRVKVLDAGYLYSNEINSYIGRLPGIGEIGVKQYESDAEFSLPIELGSLSVVLPSALKDGKPADRSTDQQMHLFVKVRAWGDDVPKKADGGGSTGKKRGGGGGSILSDVSGGEADVNEPTTSTDFPTSTDVPKPRHHRPRHRHHHRRQPGSDGDK